MYSVRVFWHMDAQQYYESLLAQGYTPEDSTKYTQEHYPDFGKESAPAAPEPAAPVPVAPAPMPMPAPGEMPAPAPMPMPGAQPMMMGMPMPNAQPMAVEIKGPNSAWRIINGVSGILLALVVLYLASSVKSDYDQAVAFLDAFGFDLTDDLESSLSTISLMWLIVMVAAVGLIGASISQFLNKPWAAKALFAANGVLMILLFITGYLEYNFVLELDEDISLFETNGLFLSYCTGICFATFALFAFLGRTKSPPVQLQN